MWEWPEMSQEASLFFSIISFKHKPKLSRYGTAFGSRKRAFPYPEGLEVGHCQVCYLVRRFTVPLHAHPPCFHQV